MCDEHRTAATPEIPVARRRVSPRPYRPAEARQAVEQAVSERCRATHTPCDAQALSDALLVASELTTNAMLHGGGVTDFRVTVEGRGVCVSVSDRSAALPVAKAPVDPHGRWHPGGHGWPIVCRLSRDVRVTDLPSGGKCITAVVPLS
ncbi:ATP-binding protein [Streptomyces sp. NRRL B-24085]|uniref:ATP-binding protein n=1 Tax=Streptomyces sp. NRRL B-24085 TaxID=1709476 RepID=UPI0006B36710|nr:ATP-binding protein [Streptomyces sp. NRRL B-24085]